MIRKNAKKKELKESLETLGDFGIIVIDEDNRTVSDEQRTATLMSLYGEDHKVLCKRLVGYSEPELKVINIKANTHSGEWDLDKLSAWTADLNLDFGLDIKKDDDAIDHDVKGMELIRFEKYNYVLIVCRTEYDFEKLKSDLGIGDDTIMLANNKQGGRKMKCRAVWYDRLPVDFVMKKRKGGENE